MARKDIASCAAPLSHLISHFFVHQLSVKIWLSATRRAVVISHQRETNDRVGTSSGVARCCRRSLSPAVADVKKKQKKNNPLPGAADKAALVRTRALCVWTVSGILLSSCRPSRQRQKSPPTPSPFKHAFELRGAVCAKDYALLTQG